ncbi:cilia and flagella-associated protein 47-like [Onthophagus taurus]|uniref:cilia and flagella-associated protein 47-like n=1 Tax=Onthophagus taurus TaxID=166361 RepID=UPI0039BE67C5
MESYDSIDTIEEEKSSLLIENVRISPARLCFKNAYAGKTIQGKICFKNEGKVDAFIRILSTPKQINVTAGGGIMLKPGRKLLRKVCVPNVDINNLKFTIIIGINNEKVVYDVIIILTCAKISFNPPSFDFGVIDENVLSTQRVLTLTNDGHSLAPFHIDISKTRGHIVLEPPKGVVMAKSKYEIKIKIIPLSVGPLHYTLVIKCDKMLIIPITATVIIPRLEAIHSRASKQFTLIYFTPTYYGLKSSQYLMIRNYSAGDCMFATDGEYHDMSLSLEELHIHNPDVHDFKLSPIDGVMQPQETKPFFITFSPMLREGLSKKLYYFCTLVVHKIRCRYLQQNFIGPDLYTKTPDTSYSYKGSLSSIVTLCSFTMPSNTTTNTAGDQELSDMEAMSYSKSHEITEKDMIRLHLCGVAETPAVKIIPDEICLPNLYLQKTEIRVLELRNLSANLPIILRYRKIPFVNLESASFYLNALESKEIAVTIVPQQLGMITSKLVFDLLYYDLPKEEQPKVIGEISINVILVVRCLTAHPKPEINKGLDPNYIRDVGKYCHDLKFSSSFHNTKAITIDVKKRLDRDCDDLVALPNENQRSLRPWRAKTACCTMFAKVPRYVPPLDPSYECTESARDFRKQNQSYYNKYIQSTLKKPKPLNRKSTDYSVTPKAELMCIGLEDNIQESETKTPCKFRHFIPLTPSQMKNIFAQPQCVKTGSIAANHNLIFPLQIHNMNQFPVRLYIRSDKANIGCIRENRYVLQGNSCIEVKLVYNSGTIGYYAANLDLIFNESMMIPVPVLINVIPRILRLNTNQIDFPRECTTQYIQLINDLNISVKFYWIINEPNFIIQPLEGVVDIGKTLKSVVTYIPEVEGPTTCIAKFVSGDCSPQLFVISCDNFETGDLDVITKEVNFENLSLQTWSFKEILIKNLSNFTVGCKIDRSNLKPDWIKITPMEVAIKPNCLFAIIVAVLCPKCVSFEGSITLMVVNDADKKYEISVKGNVVYPDIRIDPNVILFPKISSSSFAIIKFTIKNKCAAETFVNFDLEEYPEFKVTQSNQLFDKNDVAVANFLPNESKTFYIHFYPTEAMSTWFFLPITLNGILGPPLRYDTITQVVDYYLCASNEIDDDSKLINVPQKVPCVKATVFSTEPSIILSKKIVNLRVDELNVKDSYILKIKNPQTTPKMVMVKLSSNSQPFSYFMTDRESRFVELPNGTCIQFKLGSDQEREITINYEPLENLNSRVLLPIYLQTEGHNQLHTAIEINGTCQIPEIQFAPNYIEIIGNISEKITNKCTVNTNDDFKIYCRSLPTQITTFSLRTAICKNHSPNCELTMDCSNDYFSMTEGSEKIWINETDYMIDVKLINCPSESCIYESNLEISCSCGGRWERPLIGAYENSYLTTYSFSEMYLKGTLTDPLSAREVVKKSSTMIVEKSNMDRQYDVTDFWPLFPFYPTKNNEFTFFMDGCVYATEMWLYTQGFFCQTYYYIPNCISNVFTIETQDKKDKKKTTSKTMIPIVDLLNNFIGDKINDYLEIKDFPSDQVEQACYLHTIYAKIIELITKHGGTFSYICPVFYLPFNYFDIYRKSFDCEDTPLKPLAHWIENIDEFHLLTKQAWLDLILQIYKSLYLFRLPVEKSKNTPDIEPLNNFFDAVSHVCFGSSDVHSMYEDVIIAWFQYHYDNTNLWDQKEREPKMISTTGECFMDGLVLATITSVYCPYLRPFLQMIYHSPETNVENLHNLITVIQAWEQLNYSFSISADEILRPNSLRIFMLMAYMYDIMPTMYPSETMIFETGLSQNISKSIKLSNPNSYPIAYKPIIIPANTSFVLSADILIILPQKSAELNITYVAKSAKTINCNLLLSGEIPKYHYAKNKSINLIGKPDLSFPSTVITHPCYLYEVTETDFQIQTPYDKPTFYELRQSVEPVETYEELQTLPVYTDYSRFSLSRVAFTNDSFATSTGGILQLKGLIRNIFACDSTNCFYFSSPNTGDFLLQINTVWTDTFIAEDLVVNLPWEYNENAKLFVERRKLLIKIPIVNNLLWMAVKTITYTLVDSEDRSMWENILDFPAGRLIAAHLYRIASFLAPCMTSENDITLSYNLTTDNQCNIILPDQIVIKNEYEDGTIDVEWEPESLTEPWPKNFTLTLLNEQFSLLRRYNLVFKTGYEKSNPSFFK